jgi:hypothetical protein
MITRPLVLLLLSLAGPCAAQATDTTHRSMPGTGWVAVGLGESGAFGGSIAARLALSLAKGPVLGTVRLISLGNFDNDDLSDAGLLMGGRTPGRLFGTASLGVSHVTRKSFGSTAAVAYDAGIHVATSFIGIGVDLFAVLANEHYAYNSMTVTLQFGSFGR